jgi:hypothetical protein
MHESGFVFTSSNLSSTSESFLSTTLTYVVLAWDAGEQGQQRLPRAATLQPEGAACESVQHHDHQRRTHLRMHIGSRRLEPKVAALRSKGATQRQPDAQTVVGVCARGRAARRGATDRLIRPMARQYMP